MMKKKANKFSGDLLSSCVSHDMMMMIMFPASPNNQLHSIPVVGVFVFVSGCWEKVHTYKAWRGVKVHNMEKVHK